MFMEGGELNFRGNSDASIVNQGVIMALEGNIYLIGAHVVNEGILRAPNGTVGLAAGQDVGLVDGAHPSLVVRPSDNSFGGTGVLNSGLIESLSAELAANGGNVYGLAINNTGIIRATGAEDRGGRIYLVADGGNIESSGDLIAKRGTDGGDVTISTGGEQGTSARVSGLVDVSGVERGGQVSIRAGSINLSGATIDVSGAEFGLLTLKLGQNTILVDGGAGVTVGTPTDPSGEPNPGSGNLPPAGGNWSNRTDVSGNVEAQFNASTTETIIVSSTTDDLSDLSPSGASITSSTAGDTDSFMVTPKSGTLEGFGNIAIQFKVSKDGGGDVTAQIDGVKANGTPFSFDVTFTVTSTGSGDRTIQFFANDSEAITKVTVFQETANNTPAQIVEIKQLRVNNLFDALPEPGTAGPAPPPSITEFTAFFRWDPIYPDELGVGAATYGPDPQSTQTGAAERVVRRRPVINEQGEEELVDVPVIILGSGVGDSSFNVYEPPE